LSKQDLFVFENSLRDIIQEMIHPMNSVVKKVILDQKEQRTRNDTTKRMVNETVDLVESMGNAN
jgi:hypothetical protein